MLEQKANNYDVVIVGSGVSGLYAALNLKADKRVLLLTKRQLQLCNSSLAQGGVAAVFDLENDNEQIHFDDTMVAGGQKNNPKAVEFLVHYGPDEVRKLMDYGVDFDRNADGTYHLTLEGGHSRHRILHHRDATGKEIVDRLMEAVRMLPNVDIHENALLCDIQRGDGQFTLSVLENGVHSYYNTYFTIFATGGIGRVYEYTTNSAIATGDGITFAYRMGAAIRNLRLVQFHPTAFANAHTRECFLISEAVRGEGAYLLNCHGERYMGRYDDRLELAPRDVVSRSTILESQRTGSDQFYLDITRKDPAFLKQRFPMIYQNLLEEGFDLTRDRIPVFPCQHYLMGGIDVDGHARTTLDGLYAVGECSHTGVHGNNRLASNSLLEALVFSHQAALDINRRMEEESRAPLKNLPMEQNDSTLKIPKGIRTEIRRIMQHSYFVIPNEEALPEGFAEIRKIKDMLDRGGFEIDRDFIEARSLATVAYLILEEVLYHKEVNLLQTSQ